MFKTLSLVALSAAAASAMEITCAGFEKLPMTKYDNVAAQAMSHIVITFDANTPKQIMDSYRDALVCRGSSIDEPNYAAGTLSGYTMKEYADYLSSSGFISNVVFNSQVTSAVAPTLSSSGNTHENSSSQEESMDSAEESSSHSKSKSHSGSASDDDEATSGLDSTHSSGATKLSVSAAALVAVAAQF
ncbi:hypothetical protein EC988_008768, partial [Linderina pennispora]